MKQAWIDRACLALALAWTVGIARRASDLAPQLDEHVHLAQVQRLIEGSWDLHERLTVLPGLHALVAAVASLGGEPLGVGRAVVAGFAVAAWLAAFAVARREVPDRAGLRALAIATLPLAAPLGAVFYTDVPGLALLLASVWLARAGRPVASGLGAAAALLLRHSLVAYAPLVAALGVPPGASWREGLRRAAPILVVIVALGAALAGAGGVALGDRRFHGLGLHGANLPFAALLALVLLLPSHLRALGAVRDLVRHAPVACLVSASAGLALALGADATHPFNDPARVDHLLYVTWIDALFHTLGGRLALAAASVYVPLSFATWRWTAPRLGWLGPLVALRLGATWLVEPRYALAPLALVILFRPREPRWLEASYVLVYAGCSLWLVDGMVGERWFPL